jgi:FG-GAP repeat
MIHRPGRSVSWRGKILTAVVCAISTVILGAGIASASPAPGTKLATLKASGTTFSYGTSVQISGDTAVVSQDNSATSHIGRNKVYVFTKTTTGWKHTATLTGPANPEGDEFGHSVAISGGTIAVGDYCPTDDSAHLCLGRVYMYAKTSTGWKQAARFSDPTPGSGAASNDQFGWAVATTGNVVYVGAPNYVKVFDAPMHGSVFVYSKTSTGWKYSTRLAPPSNAAYSLGASVAASGSTVVAGTEVCAGPCTTDQTSAYAFTRTSSGWTSFRLRSKDLTAADRFGYAVSISGSEIAVSSPWWSSSSGHVYIFTKTSAGWKQTAELKGVNSFGYHLGLSGSRLVVATALENPRPVFFYARTAAGWKQAAKVKLPVLSANGWTPVAVSGPLAAISELGAHTYIYES